MRTDPIFVLGLMRSGTTFVQRVLNCHPEVTIWGEHGGALRPLLTHMEPFEFDEHHRERIAWGHTRRAAVIGELRDADAFDAYVSPVAPEVYEGLVDEVLRARLIELFTNGLPAGVRWGFKETRYAGHVYGALARVFPDARFVFVTRSPAPWMSSVVRAKFRGDLQPDQLDDQSAVDGALGRLRDLWLRRTSSVLRFVESTPERSVLLAHERFRSAEAAASLYGCLGLGEPPVGSVAKVLESKAGSSDIAPGWQGGVRDRLESLIGMSVRDQPEIAALELRIEKLVLDG